MRLVISEIIMAVKYLSKMIEFVIYTESSKGGYNKSKYVCIFHLERRKIIISFITSLRNHLKNDYFTLIHNSIFCKNNFI